LSDHIEAPLSDLSPFWIIRRQKLDSLLAAKAIELGAEIIAPFEVEKLQKIGGFWHVTSADKRELKARAIVIANGTSSPWTQSLRLGPRSLYYAQTTSLNIKGRGNLNQNSVRFDFGLVNNGFAWVFPSFNGVNIGIGTFMGENTSNRAEILEKLVFSLGFEPGEGERSDQLLRVWNGHYPIHGDGILCVGDAASLCDPFLAEGLRPALISSYEASKVINLWLKGSSKDLSEYSKSMRNLWGNSMAWGKRIAQVFYRFPRLGYQLGVKRPTAPKRIAQILSGEMSYENIAKRVIKRLLFRVK